MLQADLEKRLEEIENKIEELEDMILDNKLKIMKISSKPEKEGPKRVMFEEEKKPKKIKLFKKVETTENHSSRMESPKPLNKVFRPKKKDDVEDLRSRAKKIKDMLREIK